MKKTKNFFIASTMSLVIAAVIAVTMNGCNKPSATAPILPGNEFLTTTLLIISDPAHIQPTDTLVWSELPSQTSPDTARTFVTLKRNYTYNTQVIILDSTKCDTCDGFVVSNEIVTRQNYHLFCYYDFGNQNDIYGTSQSSRAPSGWANVTITNLNNDMNNPPLPFGLTASLNTFGATTGQLEVELRHQPAVKNGTCAPGSTDLDVYYNITVQ
jgi:hypothetical protein